MVCAGRDDAEIARRAAAIGREVDELRSNSPAGRERPTEIVDKLGAFAEIGVQRVYLQLLDMSDLDHLDFFATEVVAAIRLTPASAAGRAATIGCRGMGRLDDEFDEADSTMRPATTSRQRRGTTARPR